MNRAGASQERRGASLIETIAVVGLTGLILVMTAMLLGLLVRLEKSRGDDLVETAAMNGLAREVREDVRGATAIEPAALGGEFEAPKMVSMTLAGGAVVTYRAERERVFREEKQGDETTRTETYRLPDGSSVSWERAGERVSMVIRRPRVRQGAGESIVTRVEAAMGRDLRFDRPAGGARP